VRDLFPPLGPSGIWDTNRRFLRTRYNNHVLRNVPDTLTPSLCKKYDILDIPSFWDSVRKGFLIPCLDRHIDAKDLRANPGHVAQFRFEDHEINVSLGYRGTANIYEYPLQPGMGRLTWTDDSFARYLELLNFVSNLVIELVWNATGQALDRRAAEAVIQHYYLLPWTSMIDVSLDINVAKAFACYSSSVDARIMPTIYQIALLNADFYNEGATGLHSLPFARPQAQRALSLFDLGRNMEDKHGIVVGISEHVLGPTVSGTTWDDFGGSKFDLCGHQYDGIALTHDDRERLTRTMFFPSEDSTALAILESITTAGLRVLDRLGLDDALNSRVRDRFSGLRDELNLK
jgi:hypothetical protein